RLFEPDYYQSVLTTLDGAFCYLYNIHSKNFSLAVQPQSLLRLSPSNSLLPGCLSSACGSEAPCWYPLFFSPSVSSFFLSSSLSP
ncbi:MAG: hypothetical protein OEY56_02505, partial [Cyclobacteriaceae bacterium]|nr:hypothetical protein [Cyclobacteriaceae bacterium]